MHLIAGTDKDNIVRECALDFVTSAIEVISTDHSSIHEGELFTANTKFNLGAAGTRKITFLTPANSYIHFRPPVVSTSADKVTINIYELSSGNSGGVGLTATNRNRLSSRIASSVVIDNATVTTNNIQIDAGYIGGGTAVGGNSTGSANSAEDELVLKQSTLHTIEIINGSASAQDILVKIRWYEELKGV